MDIIGEAASLAGLIIYFIVHICVIVVSGINQIRCSSSHVSVIDPIQRSRSEKTILTPLRAMADSNCRSDTLSTADDPDVERNCYTLCHLDGYRTIRLLRLQFSKIEAASTDAIGII